MANIVNYGLMGLLMAGLIANYIYIGAKTGNLYTNNELSKQLEISAIITALCVFFWTIIIYIFFSINTEQAIPYLIINQGFMYFFVLFAVGQSTMTKVIRTDQYGK